MATKTDKKNAIRQEIVDAAIIYSQNLAGKTFLYVYGDDKDNTGNKINDLFLLMSLQVKDSSVEKSNDGEIIDFIFSKDASVAKYDILLVEDKDKKIPDCIKHLISNSFYYEANE